MKRHKQQPNRQRTMQRANMTMLASAISAVLGSGATHTAFSQEQVLEEVTVTGTRIVRRDLTSASPIVTVETEQFEQSSTIGVESVLNAMPHFVPGETQFDAGSTEPSGFVTPGISTVNLRGLGPNRNLVLVNGQRAQPANALLIVDVNTIPSAAIERVETITGGASAVYGPDALAGVVNFILKDDFEGVEMDLQTGQTAEGDGAETKFSSLIGFNADNGRGNVMLGVEWARREAVTQRSRPWRAAGWDDPNSAFGGFMQTPGYRANFNSPSQAAVDALFQRYADEGYIESYTPGQVSNRSEFYVNEDGSLFLNSQNGLNFRGPYNKWDLDGTGYTSIKQRPDGNLEQNFTEGNISSPLERRTLFGRATMDMTDNVAAFVQANYATVDTTQLSGYMPAITVWQGYVPRDGREIPDDLAFLLDSRTLNPADPDNTGPDAPWTVYRGFDFQGPEGARTQSDVYQIMAGLEGSLDKIDGSWQAHYSTGRTSNWYLGFGNGNLQRYQSLLAQPNWAVNANNNVLDQPYATQTVTSTTYHQTCETGIPIFAAQGITSGYSADCKRSVEAKMKQLTQIEQEIGEITLQGRVADNWAGEMRFAAGVSHRKNTFLFQPSETNDAVNTDSQAMGLFASTTVGGQQSMDDIFGELLVPLTQKLEAELGFRYSDSDITGGAETWKALFSYNATDAVRIRGGFQFATRSPNVAELYTGPAVDVVPFAPSDPCAYTTLAPWGNRADNPDRLAVQQLCHDIIGNDTSDFGLPGSEEANNHARPGAPFFPLEIELIQGNPNLQPEEASTWTVGIVLNGPGGMDNLTASFDVYNIEIADAISPLDSVFVYQQCFNGTPTGNNGTTNPSLSVDNEWCQLITRNPVNGLRSNVQAPYSNSGILETTGIDMAINWGTDIGPGNFNINTVMTYVDRFETQDNPSAPIFDAVGTLDQGGQFDYRIVNTFSYALANAQIGVQWRHYPSIRDEEAARDPTTRILDVDSFDLFNLFARYQINERFEFRGGIDNLLDEEPPVVGWDPGLPGQPSTRDHNLGTTEPGFYDPLGRRYYVGFKMGF